MMIKRYPTGAHPPQKKILARLLTLLRIRSMRSMRACGEKKSNPALRAYLYSWWPLMVSTPLFLDEQLLYGGGCLPTHPPPS